jgi:hypothetical protein
MPSYEADQRGFAWRKASFCQSGECVEVAQQGGVIIMRDSKEPLGGVLRYSVQEWRSLVYDVKAGKYDNLP